MTLSGAEPGIPSLDSFGPLGSGYLPLDLFGVVPDPIGDEEIINYEGIDPFLFNGKTYNTIGVDSNGYIVAGGATSDDNECCDLPTGPHPGRPNDMVAPFWTDLDGTDTDGIYAASLTDGVNFWTVIEYRVNVFGTTDERIFQVWLGSNGVQDISFNYGNDPVEDPDGQDFLVGAENEIGEGEMTATLPTEDLIVVSTDPTPGASVHYRVVVRGVKVGTGQVRTIMTGDGLPGTTIVRSNILVTP